MNPRVFVIALSLATCFIVVVRDTHRSRNSAAAIGAPASRQSVSVDTLASHVTAAASAVHRAQAGKARSSMTLESHTFTNILPAQCSMKCAPTLDEARDRCSGPILTCYACDDYTRPFHEPHLFRNSIHQQVATVASVEQSGWTCIHIPPATETYELKSGAKPQKALSLPGPCDFRTRTTLFLGLSLFTSRCSCIGFASSFDHPMFTHPIYDKCVMTQLGPLAHLGRACHHEQIHSMADITAGVLASCTRCGGVISTNEVGFTMCLPHWWNKNYILCPRQYTCATKCFLLHCYRQ